LSNGRVSIRFRAHPIQRVAWAVSLQCSSSVRQPSGNHRIWRHREKRFKNLVLGGDMGQRGLSLTETFASISKSSHYFRATCRCTLVFHTLLKASQRFSQGHSDIRDLHTITWASNSERINGFSYCYPTSTLVSRPLFSLRLAVLSDVVTRARARRESADTLLAISTGKY
jgi:hypothetical protein